MWPAPGAAPPAAAAAMAADGAGVAAGTGAGCAARVPAVNTRGLSPSANRSLRLERELLEDAD
jgi:hypothetical protein